MKKLLSLAVVALLAFGANAQTTETQKTVTLPSVTVKDMTGKPFNVATLNNNGKPMIINFWATWCKPCLLELQAINDVYAQWQTETGVKLVAVSLDDSRTSSKVPSVVNGKGWTYEVLVDENGDLRRAMNVNNPPHTFVLNGKGEVVYQHNSYAPGDEDALYEMIKKLNAEESGAAK